MRRKYRRVKLIKKKTKQNGNENKMTKNNSKKNNQIMK